jgi:hypothetical protein
MLEATFNAPTTGREAHQAGFERYRCQRRKENEPAHPQSRKDDEALWRGSCRLLSENGLQFTGPLIGLCRSGHTGTSFSVAPTIYEHTLFNTF